jgi:hypothetical protein
LLCEVALVDVEIEDMGKKFFFKFSCLEVLLQYDLGENKDFKAVVTCHYTFAYETATPPPPSSAATQPQFVQICRDDLRYGLPAAL